MALVTVSQETPLQAIDKLRSEQGWVYASSTSIEAGDPGRYHCLFGRDSLITALQVLPVRPQIAVDTLRALAAEQGTITDPETDEEPGRIVHEFRPVAPQYMIDLGWPVRDGQIKYYGSSDSVSWFLHLLHATGDTALQSELADARQAAGEWLELALKRGHGFVRCGGRSLPGGLEHQGWRDAQDPAHDEHGGGIVLDDGSLPTPPVADADSQAAALTALRALAQLEPERKTHWDELSAALAARITDAFAETFAMAVDGDDAPVFGAGSQLGWLLWADALPPAQAKLVADRLVRPDVMTPFGARTLSSLHPAFFPEGYHRGSIWPFDNWFVWGGLRAIGHPDAERVRRGVLTALKQLGHFPELYTVTETGALKPAAISNRIQAWTVGACVAFGEDWDGRTVLNSR